MADVRHQDTGLRRGCRKREVDGGGPAAHRQIREYRGGGGSTTPIREYGRSHFGSRSMLNVDIDCSTSDDDSTTDEYELFIRRTS